MEYYRTYWQHDDDYPVWIYSEIDNHRYDTRGIEIFRNGSAKNFDIEFSKSDKIKHFLIILDVKLISLKMSTGRRLP